MLKKNGKKVEVAGVKLPDGSINNDRGFRKFFLITKSIWVGATEADRIHLDE